MYNQIEKQRQLLEGDANRTLLFFRKMAVKDPLLYVRYEQDADGSLRQLFWADGRSQIDYLVFGDVMTFFATYARINISVHWLSFPG